MEGNRLVSGRKWWYWWVQRRGLFGRADRFHCQREARNAQSRYYHFLPTNRYPRNHCRHGLLAYERYRIWFDCCPSSEGFCRSGCQRRAGKDRRLVLFLSFWRCFPTRYWGSHRRSFETLVDVSEFWTQPCTELNSVNRTQWWSQRTIKQCTIARSFCVAISLRRCRYGLLHRLIGPSASPSLNVSAVTSSNPSNGQSSPSSAPITEWHSALRLPVRSQRVGCAFFENASNVPSSRPSEAPTMLSSSRSRPHALFLALV